MVCKEDLCRWFKNLSPRKRIEYMCGLLHMCLPLELRFIGTVLEDYGKRDYHYLRDGEIKANNSAEIVKYRDLPADYLRAKIVTALALLHSSNTACAQAIFDTLESDPGGAFGPSDDSEVMEDVLTIFALAANHPAFLFEQKRKLYERLVRLDNRRKDIFRDAPEDDDPPLDLCSEAQPQYHHTEDTLHFPQHPLCNRHSPIPHQRRVCIQSIEVKDSRKSGDRPRDPEVYTIHTTWSNGEVTEVEKKFKEVQDFHHQLLELFPDENRLPNLPVPNHQTHSNRGEHMSEQYRSLNTYLKSFSGVPSHILESDHISQFFKGVVVRPAQPLPASVPYHPMGSMPEDEGNLNAIPVLKSPYRPPQYYYFVNDPSRMPHRFGFPQQLFPFPGAPQRFPPSHACPYVSPPHHISPQQPPSSPPPGSNQSSASSPANSRQGSPAPQVAVPDPSASVSQLLKLLCLEKYSGVLGTYTVEQLKGLSAEEMSKLGLPREAQVTLHSKLDQISDKPGLINGLIDSPAYPSSSASPASPWAPPSPGSMPFVHYQQRPGMSASPRSNISAADSASPPPSPGPPQSLQGKAQGGDTSDEELDRDKADSATEVGKSSVYYSKSAQVKVVGRGGAGSPHQAPNMARMTPPDDASKVAMVHPQQVLHPGLMPFYHPLHPHPHLMAHTMHGQYLDPKGEMGLMGAAPGAHINSNTNNNYTTEPGPIMSTGIPMRQPLLQAGVGTNAVRAAFKGGQPQPAHTNMTGTLQAKNLITMPADPKPGSPIVTPMGAAYVGGLRPPDIQAPAAQNLVTSTAPALETGATPRMNLMLPLGRGQGAHLTTPLPPGHQAQSVIPYPTIITRSVSTTFAGTGTAMTVSSAHLVTTVTGSHVATPSTTSQRSPSHNGQRDAVTDPAANDPALRMSPVQGNGVSSVVSVAAEVQAPALAQHVHCHLCNQYTSPHLVYNQYPYWHTHNGLISPAMSGFYAAQGQPIASGVLTNGFGPDVYSYPAGYPTVTPTGHIQPLVYGNSIYHGVPAQQNATPTCVSAGANGPSAPSLGGSAMSVGQGVSIASRPRKEGCYNCGSSTHKPSECPENTMETISGHFHLNYKPRPDSD